MLPRDRKAAWERVSFGAHFIRSEKGAGVDMQLDVGRQQFIAKGNDQRKHPPDSHEIGWGMVTTATPRAKVIVSASSQKLKKDDSAALKVVRRTAM